MNLMKVFFNLSYILSYTISGDIMPRVNFNICESCLDRQARGENIACPTQCDTITPECNTDEECGDLYFCRPTTMDSDGPKESFDANSFVVLENPFSILLCLYSK